MGPAPRTDAPSDEPVRRRCVFYVGGFDPQGPAHYHRLYVEEGARQAAVGGYRIEVGPRHPAGPVGARWDVRTTWPDGATVSTQVEFLRWDDIVRAHWPRNRWMVMLSALASTARQVANGVLWRILKTSWPAFLVLAFPPGLVLVLAGWLVGTAGVTAWLLARGAGAALAAAVVVASLAAWTIFARWAERKVQMAWLMRSTRFILKQARGEAPGLEDRLDAFAARILEAWRDEEVQEVLVVGHSSGAMLAVSSVARALSLNASDGGVATSVRASPASADVRARASRAGADMYAPASPEGADVRAPASPRVERVMDGPAHARRLSLLTLGECIPMLSYQPEARAFRTELATLARATTLDWIDFTAPPDGCCFALVDPTAVCPERSSAPHWQPPKRLSPRFAHLFSAATYRRIRRDKHRCHFQYLMATERAGDYDYFAITAGPLRLPDRFRALASVQNFRDFQLFGGPS